MRRLLAALFLACGCVAQAATIEGKVINVADGDTVTILDATHQRHRVRINGIDAPEKGQPFGDRSRKNMAHLVAGKGVTADCHKADRFGRQVCKVWVQPSDCPKCGKTLDAGHAQIVAGMAWWYRDYAKEQSAEDRGRYESDEQEAKARKRGLWSDGDPVAPWEWRGKSK
jgi:endonuclease YncB( thermonuclease family)